MSFSVYMWSRDLEPNFPTKKSLNAEHKFNASVVGVCLCLCVCFLGHITKCLAGLTNGEHIFNSLVLVKITEVG